MLGRTIDYTDARLADEFTREVSLRLIQHATRLDLASFEDPAFHDVLERARQQATDRIGMLNAMGRLLLQSITLISLSVGVIFYSPWLFLLLVVCVVPAFMGESHFAFLGYSLAHEITPVRRELDYLRIIGTSKENAKEVKLFGLGESFARSLRVADRRNHSQEHQPDAPSLAVGIGVRRHWIHRLLRQLRVSGVAGAAGAHHRWHVDLSDRFDRGRQHSTAGRLLVVLAYCRSGAAFDGPGRVPQGTAEHPFASRTPCRCPGPFARASNFGTSRSTIPDRRVWFSRT